jgi:hypothetical protein
MKQKKLVIYFITIITLLLTPLPIFNTIILSLNNNIELNKFNKKSLFSTDKVESNINYLFYKIFQISLNKKQVIVGKDDFLFLGNGYARILDKTQGKYEYEERDIDKWTNKLKNIQTWYEDRGIKFAIVIAPNKHTVYKEKLPNWMKYDGRTITDDIVSYSEKKSINLLDLRKSLQEKKATQLYFTTDTHWNNQGSAIGYEDTIKYINNIYKTKYKIPNYELLTTHRRSGDLASFLKINSILAKNYETNYTYKFENESDVCHGNIDKKQIIEKCSNKKNPVMGINRNAQYMINKSSLSKDKLLLLCDSFGTANSKLYNETFNTIWKFHYGHINGGKLSNFVSKHKPDIVIYQVVERNLYNNGIVKKLSDISTVNYNNNGSKIFDINNIKYKYYKNNRLTITDKELITTHLDPIIILNKLNTKSKFIRLNYNLDSSVKTHFQLFYKENKSDKYSEDNSYRVAIKKGKNKISLSIPAKYINNQLRVDLVGRIGKYKINDFSIYEVE